MTTTMQLIAKQTVGAGGTTGITFSNIPQTYDDLKIVISARLTNTSYGETIRVKPNGSAANGFSRVLRAYGTGVSAYRVSWISATNNALGDGAVAGAFTSIQMYCTNYASSGYKSFSTESASPNNTTDGRLELASSLWSDNTAITSISFDNNAGTPFAFKEGSTFYLYGISKNTTTQATTVPYASGGDVITTDGSYWYHTFLYSGTFTPLKNLTCDYLVVAGGGGGGCNVAGGGGAGGLRSTVGATGGGGSLESPLSLLANTVYMATIGAGGIGGAGTDTVAGSDGSNSVFATITSTGGGGGGTFVTNTNGRSGGSGGGGAAGSTTGGTRTTGQGYAGGNGGTFSGGNYPAGGGGGAGAVGSNGTNNGAAGNGGNGVTTSISGTSVTYAGGGGGGTATGTVGTGGTGGGGNGRTESVAGSAGTVNTGGGGGGGNQPSSSRGGYQGGSGIIVVRYAV